MKKNIIWDSAKPLENNSLIIEFERKYGVMLPKEYVSFILQNNGAYPEPNCFDTSKDVRVLDSLISFDKDEEINMFNTIEDLREVEALPEYIIPFAGDPFGNHVCFNFSGESYSIVFWNYDDDEIESICDSFDQFLNMLYEDEE